MCQVKKILPQNFVLYLHFFFFNIWRYCFNSIVKKFLLRIRCGLTALRKTLNYQLRLYLINQLLKYLVDRIVILYALILVRKNFASCQFCKVSFGFKIKLCMCSVKHRNMNCKIKHNKFSNCATMGKRKLNI